MMEPRDAALGHGSEAPVADPAKPRAVSASSTSAPGAAEGDVETPVDSAAFRRAFEDNAERVYRLLLRLGVSARDVEDLCQEVFVVAHRNWHNFRGEAKRSTWLCGIAVRLAANHRRLARVRRERLRDPQLGTPEAIPGGLSHTPATQADGLDTQRRADTLHRVLAELSESYRQVLVMYELEELPMAEVADALEIPLQTGYSRLYAGRKALRQALQRLAARGDL